VADRFWSEDLLGTFDMHGTAKAARAAAWAALDYYRREANRDAWPDEVTGIRWGMVLGEVHQTRWDTHGPDCTAEDCADGCPVSGRSLDYEEADYDLVDDPAAAVLVDVLEVRSTFGDPEDYSDRQPPVASAWLDEALALPAEPGLRYREIVDAVAVLVAMAEQLREGVNRG
jgi:hypothetical protein